MKKESLRKGKKKMWIILSGILVFFAVAVCIVLPPSFGKTRIFKDGNGEALEGSISEKRFLDINGTTLGMFIMAKDSGKPVLLFLSGGPGIPEYLLEYQYPTGIEEHFVVCYPDYRGTSLSFDPNADPESLTLDQYVDDAVAITNYLRERFGQEKIYLMGHSFGTYVGINVADRYPELYHSYIAMSQAADMKKSETLAYNYMYEQYKSQGNEKMVKQFEKYPINESEEAFEGYKSGLRDNAMHDLGVGTMRDMRSVISGLFFPSLRFMVYTPIERINIWRAKAFVKNSPAAEGIFNFNAFEETPEIDIPVYFFGGKYDLTCAYSLQKEYYDMIKAPMKAFYTFHDSAHSPLFEEPGKALEILSEDVLTGAKVLADEGI